MKEHEKVQYMLPCCRPASLAMLSKALPSSSRAAQKQTEAIMCRRKPAASNPAASPQPARRHGRSPVAAPTLTQPQQPSTRQHHGAGLRQDTQPVQAPANEEESGECYISQPDPAPAITGQAVTGPRPGPCVPPRCPTAGTSVASLAPLARSLGAWLALPSPSRWLLWTIRLGYVIQFARHPPKFTSVKAVDAPFLCVEIAFLLEKDAIKPVPPADMRSGFYSPYFILPKKSGGLRPILDLRVLNRALHKLRAQGSYHSTSASWIFGSTGKRANSPRHRGSLFSVWSWIRSNRQHASQRNVRGRCWTAWIHSRAGQRSHWINFRGSWGIWQLQWQLHRCGCFIQYETASALASWPCPETFTPWSDLAFLWARLPLEQVSRHAVVHTVASTTGWGAMYNGQAVLGVWTVGMGDILSFAIYR